MKIKIAENSVLKKAEGKKVDLSSRVGGGGGKAIVVGPLVEELLCRGFP